MSYTDLEIKFINDLLKSSQNNNLTYSKFINDDNLPLYNKLFNDLHLYKLISKSDDKFIISTKGREVVKIGFKQYLKNLKSEEELDKSIKQLTHSDLISTNKRSKIAIILSIVSIIVTLFIGVLNNIKINKSHHNIIDYRYNTKDDSNIASEVIHSQKPSKFIDTTFVEKASDTTNIFSNHNN